MMNKKLKISVIGCGFVGKAVINGFDETLCDITPIDIKYDTTVEDTNPYDDIFFVCLPTPMNDDGSVDAMLVIETVKWLKLNRAGHIVIKSTITPDIIDKLSDDRVIYNPEFLTEKSADEDFINPSMHIFGGHIKDTNNIEKIYKKYSKCKPCPCHHVTLKEASFIKYGINCFLATKVLWFNQFYDIIQKHDCNFDEITYAMRSDPRIGNSHTSVPGFDGKMGFGGACFPKDTSAFLDFAISFSVLNEVIQANNKIRSEYTKDKREFEQNVSFSK